MFPEHAVHITTQVAEQGLPGYLTVVKFVQAISLNIGHELQVWAVTDSTRFYLKAAHKNQFRIFRDYHALECYVTGILDCLEGCIV
jgi:hypothetical protein